jgi:hypothetical protein
MTSIEQTLFHLVGTRLAISSPDALYLAFLKTAFANV